MDEDRFRLYPATEADAETLAQCFLDSFTRGSSAQARFFTLMVPPTPGTTAYYAESFRGQLKQQRTGRDHFVKIIDSTKHNSIAGFAQWIAPNAEPAFRAKESPDMNMTMRNELLGSKEKHKKLLMGDRPFWYLQVLAVIPEYQGQGIGKRLMDYGRACIDNDGVEAFVSATPDGSGLYAKYGFETRERGQFPEPDCWYEECYMVRPASKCSS